MEFKLKSIESILEIPKIANVHFFEFEKDHRTKDDSHSFYEMLFSYSGTLTIDSESYHGKLRRGEMIIHAAGERHSLRTHKNKKNTVVIIGFQSSSDAPRYFSKKPVQLDENEKKQLAKIVREGRNVFSPPYDIPLYDMKKKPRSEQLYGSEQMLRSLLETFLIELVRKHVYYKNEDELGERDLLFDEILSYVDAHFTDKITLDELAFMFNTNRSAFCQRFKALTGYTLVEYIAQKKVARIKKLLTETDRSVSEISNELNFESVAYLCRFFKKHTGSTPKEYRKETREA